MCENEKKKYHSIEMTTGSLWKNILLFSLPLMGSQVLEVLFNLSDVAVVGRFADYMALGAVGSTTLLVTLFTGILIGMGAGVNVRVAHELGDRYKKGTEETNPILLLLLCAITGLLVCAICLLFSGRMLSMMNTKPELIDQGYFIYEDLFPGNACNGRIQFRKRRIKCHRRYETTIDLPFHCRCGQCLLNLFLYCLSYGSRRRCNSQRNFSVYLCFSGDDPSPQKNR